MKFKKFAQALRREGATPSILCCTRQDLWPKCKELSLARIRVANLKLEVQRHPSFVKADYVVMFDGLNDEIVQGNEDSFGYKLLKSRDW